MPLLVDPYDEFVGTPTRADDVTPGMWTALWGRIREVRRAGRTVHITFEDHQVRSMRASTLIDII